jgi:hypothetical protein
MTPGLVVAAILLVLGVVPAARIAWVVTHPVSDGVRRAQLVHLRAVLADGGATRMQELFPEGYAFTHALIGLAAAQPARPGDSAALALARQCLAAMDSPQGRAPFPPDASPAHGAFWTGWSLLLAVEVARLSGQAADLQQMRRRADVAAVALAADADGFLESYPGQVWPVDTVVLVAAVARAHHLEHRPGEVASAWLRRTAAARDPRTGLFPHQLTPAGAALTGPRGSSSALALAFEPDIDPARAAADHRTFEEHFVVRRAGLAGVLEYPRGTRGQADVDSGPLVAGVSLSASAVALATAYRQRDDALIRALNSEAEVIGIPVSWQGARRYGLGVLPIGDAFLAWARAQRPAAIAAGTSDTPAPAWWAWALVPLMPGLIVGAVTQRRRRRQARVGQGTQPEPAQPPEVTSWDR